MRIFTLITSLFLFSAASADLTVYTDRANMQPIVDSFKAATGTTVNIVQMPYADIKAKLQQEGASSPADVVFTKDMLYLTELANNNLLAAMNSTATSAVDPSMRDAQNRWVSVTYRARTLIYDASVDVGAINTYEDLAKPDYASTLCLRTGKADYNRALTSFLIASYGAPKARAIVDGWLANRPEPFTYPDDTKIIEAITLGKCTFGITNSYYLGLYLVNQPNAPVKIKFLNQAQGGVHTNGTGAGITATSKQAPMATKFVEHLLSKDVQILLSNAHQDFPSNTTVKAVNKSAAWGPFTVNHVPWANISSNVEQAKKIITDSNWL